MVIDISTRPVVCNAEAWIRPLQTAGYRGAWLDEKVKDHKQLALYSGGMESGGTGSAEAWVRVLKRRALE